MEAIMTPQSVQPPILDVAGLHRPMEPQISGPTSDNNNETVRQILQSAGGITVPTEIVDTPHANQAEVFGLALPENNPLSDYTQHVGAHNNI